ncbi:MAG: biopolymer transporter ExbD [Pseudomonadota bacterium]
MQRLLFLLTFLGASACDVAYNYEREKSLNVEAPSSVLAAEDAVSIYINADGDLIVEGQSVLLENLKQVVSERLVAKGVDQIALHVDPKTKTGRIIEVRDLLQSTGLELQLTLGEEPDWLLAERD